MSVPLATVLAITAGGKPMQGLITAIYGPAMGGLFGGSNYNIFGPAGALVNIMMNARTTDGQEVIPFLAIGGGILIHIVYRLKLD